MFNVCKIINSKIFMLKWVIGGINLMSILNVEVIFFLVIFNVIKCV